MKFSALIALLCLSGFYFCIVRQVTILSLFPYRLQIDRLKRISILPFLFCCLPYMGIGQLPPEEINRIKSKLNDVQPDSIKFALYYDLSEGYRFSNLDSAHYYTDKALALSRSMNNTANEARALSQKGFLVLVTGDIPQSLQYQFASLRLSEKFSNPQIESFTLNRIGNVYVELGDYKKAIDYYKISMEKFAQINQQGYVYNELSNIGNAYEMMGMLDSAKMYQQKVYEFSRSNKDRYAITYGEMRQRLGKVETRLGNYDAALEHYRAGISESMQDFDFSNLAVNNVQLAELFEHLHLYDSSFIYAKKAMEAAEAISSRPVIFEASGLLVKLFKLKKQPDSALAYSQLSAITRDSLYGTQKIHDLQRILLNEQQRQQTLQEQQEQLRQQYRFTALLATMGILLVIGAILYRNNLQKKKANKVLEKTLNDLKATQAQLIQAEKMASLGQLTAGIAHEIQNPLNFVNNFSEVNNELIDELKTELAVGKLQSAVELANDIEHNLEKINHHGKRADAIVKGMLQHSQSGKGQKQPTDINALCDEYLRLAYHGLRAKDNSFNATTKTEFDSSIGQINMVAQDIGRVLLNLYNNAFYAVNEKIKGKNEKYEPAVTVRTKKLGDKVEITVEDNGNGIPENLVDKIFQPFFTTKPTGQGTGLGLSLAYDIIKAHGGNIQVNTKHGEGCKFIILLPV